MVGVIEGPIATKSRPQDRDRMTIMPCESWMVIELRSALDEGAGAEDGGSADSTRLPVLCWKGWWRFHSVQATVDWVRRIEAERGEELERSLPVGEMRRRVGSWGEAFWERKVVRGLVRSMVWDIGLWRRESWGWGRLTLKMLVES